MRGHMKIFSAGFFAVAAMATGFAGPIWLDVGKKNEELWKNGLACEQIIDELEKLRTEAPYATNLQSRVAIDRCIVMRCRRPGWGGLKRWNVSLEHRIPAVVRRLLSDGEVGYGEKVEFAGYLSEYLSGEKDFEGAEAVLREVLDVADKKMPQAEVRALMALADVYRWQDRFEDAWKVLDTAVEKLSVSLAVVNKAFVLAAADGNLARAEKLAERIANVGMRLGCYVEAGQRTDKAVKLALDFVLDSKNDINSRATVALTWFAEECSPERADAYAALRSADKAKLSLASVLAKPLNRLYWHADWAGVVEFFEVFKGAQYLDAPRLQRMYVISLVMCGRRDDAIKVLESRLADKTLKPLDRVKFEVTQALLAGRDSEEVVKAAKLSRKDEITALATAARQALTFGLNEPVERLAARHASYFVDFPQRTLKVLHVKTPVESIADWRAVREKLDRQFCDRPFGADLDALETDVASGRQKVETTDLDSVDVRAEISAISDVNGLHIYRYVRDPNARAVQGGFAGGMGAEIYFAPGKYEPYLCFWADARTGIDGAFQTTYNYSEHRRVDISGVKDKNAFRCETLFTDKDYVQHFFFAWDSFYQKLPTDGTKWRFECIAFGPKGPFTLGGSENVHNSSKWCDLEFRLDQADIVAIRRAMLARAVKGWNKVGHLERFDMWADTEIGDPEFYEAVLKPIEAELKGYAKEVRQDMSDEDVNRVFEKALKRWMGISHEIDELRRVWLLEKAGR